MWIAAMLNLDICMEAAASTKCLVLHTEEEQPIYDIRAWCGSR